MKNYISRGLRSSSTAIWPDVESNDVTFYYEDDTNTFLARMSLEAQNAYGAYGKLTGIFRFDSNLNMIEGYVR